MAGTTRGKDERRVTLDAGELREIAAAAQADGGDNPHPEDFGEGGDADRSGPKTRARKPGQISDHMKAKVRKLAREGMSRNEIVRKTGVSAGSVSAICKAAKPPISFDRAATAQATVAKVADLKSQRADLAQDALTEVRRLFTLLTAEHEVIHWDSDGFMHRGLIERPTSGDVKNYATSIGILMDKHLALVKFDSDDRDLPAVDLFLAEISGGVLS